MVFYVEPSKKKELGRRNSKTKLVLILKWLEAIALCATGMMVLLRLIMVYRSHVTQPSGGDTSFLSSFFVILAVGCFIWFFINRVVSNLSGKDITERKDEELNLSEDKIRYVFRLRNQIRASNRYIITMQRTTGNQVLVDNEHCKITLLGECVCQNVIRYGTRYETMVDQKVLQEFSIYDYFEPSLISMLNNSWGD